MKKKITLGKPTLRSVEIQIASILQHLFKGDIDIKKIQPIRTNTGNVLSAHFETAKEPGVPHIRIFAMQRVGSCCDVWLEGPSNPCEGSEPEAA